MKRGVEEVRVTETSVPGWRVLHSAVVGMWVAVCSSYLVYKVFAFVHANTLRAHALDELKETSYASIYAFLAIVFLISETRRVH